MSFQTLTLQSIRARPIVLKLKRPVVARIATLGDWPLILIDLHTEEGVIGRSYLEPYLPKSMRYLIPALHDLGEMLKGHRVAPIEFYEAARKSLHFVGYEACRWSPLQASTWRLGMHWRRQPACRSACCWEAVLVLCRLTTAMGSG
jgi:hypothetical protein